jgi:hypothetical protein
MTTRLHIIGGAEQHLAVDESPKEAAASLWHEDYAELHVKGKAVLVNPAAIGYIDQAGTPQVGNLGDYTETAPL